MWLTHCAVPSAVKPLTSAREITILVVGWPVGVWNLLRLDSEVRLPPDEVAGWLFAATGACAVAGLGLWWCAGRALERGE